MASNKYWVQAEELMTELGIPIDLEDFISSFGPKYSKKISDAIGPEVESRNEAQAFLSLLETLHVGAYVPKSFLTENDGSLAEFLKPTRTAGKSIKAALTAESPRCSLDLAVSYFACLVKFMEIQAKSPFAICHLCAAATLRLTIDSFVSVVSRPDFDQETALNIQNVLRVPELSFDEMLRGEIGFAYYANTEPVSDKFVEDWKQAAKMSPSFKPDYRQAVMRQRLPKLNRLAVAKYLQKICLCLKEYRRLNGDFKPGMYTSIMTKKGLGNTVQRFLVGNGSIESFEMCLSYGRAIQYIQKWIDETLDTFINPDRSEFRYDSNSLSISVTPFESKLELRFLTHGNNQFVIQRTVT